MISSLKDDSDLLLLNNAENIVADKSVNALSGNNDYVRFISFFKIISPQLTANVSDYSIYMDESFICYEVCGYATKLQISASVNASDYYGQYQLIYLSSYTAGVENISKKLNYTY